jgi:hypothetical protein
MSVNVKRILLEPGGLVQYRLCMTPEQIERVLDFNARSKPENQWRAGWNMDAIEIVDKDDPTADMIIGHWWGMTVGILPDGSAHS